MLSGQPKRFKHVKNTKWSQQGKKKHRREGGKKDTEEGKGRRDNVNTLYICEK